jgi:hypothetical protein
MSAHQGKAEMAAGYLCFFHCGASDQEMGHP